MEKVNNTIFQLYFFVGFEATKKAITTITTTREMLFVLWERPFQTMDRLSDVDV